METIARMAKAAYKHTSTHTQIHTQAHPIRCTLRSHVHSTAATVTKVACLPRS